MENFNFMGFLKEYYTTLISVISIVISVYTYLGGKKLKKDLYIDNKKIKSKIALSEHSSRYSDSIANVSSSFEKVSGDIAKEAYQTYNKICDLVDSYDISNIRSKRIKHSLIHAVGKIRSHYDYELSYQSSGVFRSSINKLKYIKDEIPFKNNNFFRGRKKRSDQRKVDSFWADVFNLEENFNYEKVDFFVDEACGIMREYMDFFTSKIDLIKSIEVDVNMIYKKSNFDAIKLIENPGLYVPYKNLKNKTSMLSNLGLYEYLIPENFKKNNLVGDIVYMTSVLLIVCQVSTWGEAGMPEYKILQ